MRSKTLITAAGLALLAVGLTGLVLTGCATPEKTAEKGAPASPSGVQLWAQNCGHCHNIRSPGSYSDAQWDVIALHMRVRANLPAEDHRQILAFLKSAH